MQNNGVKITKIKITEFRRFQNVEFDIGDCITLISGQNGTSKSTLLGMLCQPFSFGVAQRKSAGATDNSKYTSNYHGQKLTEHKDLTGNLFIYTCENVFRLSKLHDTDPTKYMYRLYLKGDCITKESPIYDSGLLVRAQRRGEKKQIRFVAGPGISSEAGEGNFPHPVIYFGLNRHWPLALVKKMKIDSDPEIDAESRNWYIENYNSVLLLNESANQAEFITAAESTKRDFIGVSSRDYNSESFSAGQDNLGQILTAILSYKRLKSNLGEKYQGGLILIDELDSTLHADAQMRLLEMLCEAARNYQLQIVATTHSLYMLDKAFNSHLKTKIKVIYLKREDDRVVDSGFTSFDEIEHNLQVKATVPKIKSRDKVSLIFEDDVSKNMFFGIIGGSIKKYLNQVIMESLNAGSLKNLAALSARVPELSKVIFIPDGDVKSNIKKKNNLIFLPGDKRPETLVYECLYNLSEADPFWHACSGTGYSKQFAIVKYKANEKSKAWYKNWFKEQSPFWGKACKIAFEKWADSNKEMCKRFCEEFFEAFNKVLPGTLPKETTQKIIDKYSSSSVEEEDVAIHDTPSVCKKEKSKKTKVANENMQLSFLTQGESS
ncbi:MAG: DNA replication and repair protein RecF [Syntrophus sp. PtaB.Bin138]|nr:MAG: DNA replication and repair protein RecF [Syntrophus sp. PtaB.Bin138]